MITYVPNNLWGTMIPHLDNAKLTDICLNAEKFLINRILDETKIEMKFYGSKTTASYQQYNLLSFPIESFQNLYHNIVSVIKPCLPKETHVMQCWLNVFKGNEFIDWHGHWPKEHRVVHGFYCVNVTPSFTEYRFKHIPDKTYRVESKEGLLVFGKSNDDSHRSSPWTNVSEPRVTIAFDIIPISTLKSTHMTPNHYLPF